MTCPAPNLNQRAMNSSVVGRLPHGRQAWSVTFFLHTGDVPAGEAWGERFAGPDRYVIRILHLASGSRFRITGAMFCKDLGPKIAGLQASYRKPRFFWQLLPTRLVRSD